MRLEKWQRNAIFEAVKRGGLDVRDCTFDYDDVGARITHAPSESYFHVKGNPSEYEATAVVGERELLPFPSYTWTGMEERVQRWAEEVKRDADTPDLWAELQREREILTGAGYEAVENTPFTAEEQAEIAKQGNA